MKRRHFVQSLLATPLLKSEATPTALRLAPFHADITPPLGSPLCHGNVAPAREIVTPLTARGVILLGAQDPVVLCAMDWVALANDSHEILRESLAGAVGTTPDRVAVHTVHQHDAPGSDLGAEALLAERGLGGRFSNADFDRRTFAVIAAAAKEALGRATVVTDIGLGSAEVDKVASNRRVLGPDGKVLFTRMSASRHPQAATAPEGTVDPRIRLVSFWHGATPLAALTYYATHPMSYYGRGGVNWDFVGGARALLEEALPGVACVHFNGAGGNITAGKYNNGDPQNRPALAERLAKGMRTAWETQGKTPVHAGDASWRTRPVSLPLRNPEADTALLGILGDPGRPFAERARAAREIVFIRRTRAGRKIPLGCLRLGNARILHMPAELFVEYQLAAQQMRPRDFIAMAAYGDNGPGYIGTEIAYSQGGYETGPVSRVAPRVEGVLLGALKDLLEQGI